MPLEDHVGDVVGKARKGLGVDAATVAKAAGLDSGQYQALEEAGQFDEVPDFQALGELLGLNPNKLTTIATGWKPLEIDWNIWRGFQRITTNQGMEVHCYLVWDEETKGAALFDTGWEAAPIIDAITENGLRFEHLFLTHTHHDHIAALTPIRNQYPEVKLHSSSQNAPAVQQNDPGQMIQLGNLSIANYPTPGHADDGVTYLVENFPALAPPLAMVGDAIFAGSIGGAPDHFELAKQKVREHILSLPPETHICPGHGPVSTVAEQRVCNPFF